MRWGWFLRCGLACCVVLAASCGKTQHDDAPDRAGDSAGGGAAGTAAAGGGAAGGLKPSQGGQAPMVGRMPEAAGGDTTAAGAANGAGGDAEQPVTYFDPSDSANWSELEVSALKEVDGFYTKLYDGAAFDGRFAYFAPEPYQYDQAALRYDTQGPFSDVLSWKRFSNARDLGGFAGARGAAFAGGFVYMAPHLADEVCCDTVAARFAPRDFGSRIETFDFSNVSGFAAAGEFAGAVNDGRYVTFVPGVARWNQLARYDTTLPFAEPSSWEFSTRDQVQGAPWVGGFCDGRYVYLSPTETGIVVQIDTQRRLAEPKAYRYHDLGGPTSGAVFDGRYAYFAPTTGLSLWRFDTQMDFAAGSSWKQIHIQRPPNAPALDLKRPGAFDGRYLYLFSETELIRLDTEEDPDLPDAWRTHSLNIMPEHCVASAQTPCAVTSSVFDGEYLNIVSGQHYRRLHVRSPKLPWPLPNGGSFF